ncbi:DUF1922 domain-containing protein [Candidatus Bathyarchaeota archaeon]|nr:DUF1922 domain-containing protein [Candidatus Bathyarchaeota archaeon]
MYKVLVCTGCGRLLVADADKKSRRCPYCEVRIQLHKAKAVGTAKTAIEASELARYFKQRNAHD